MTPSTDWRRLVAVLSVAAGGLAACGDSFTPTQPLVGHVLYEWQGTVPAAGVMLGGPLSALFLPGNVAPPGTTLTVRLSSQITKSPPSGWPLPPFAGPAMQILPEGLTFPQPLVFLETPSSWFAGEGLTTIPIDHMFRANAGDSAWTWSSFAQGPDDRGLLSWPIDRSGLWIRGEAPTSAIGGTYRFLGSLCSAGTMATPLVVYLTIAGDRYSLTGAAPACHDEGAFAAPYSLTAAQGVVDFEVMVTGTALRLKTGGDFLGICGGASSSVLFFDFAGCATDADCGAGGQCNGELCGPTPTVATGSCLTGVTGTAGGK